MVNCDILTTLSGEFSKIEQQHLQALIELYEGQATVPFIAAYRADMIGGLDEQRISAVLERYRELRSMNGRKILILKEMEDNGAINDEIAEKVKCCLDQFELEDMYLPFKQRSRTRAVTSKERGLEPLAEIIWDQQTTDLIETIAAPFIDPEKKVNDLEEALEGAVTIMAEWIALNATARKTLRIFIWDTGKVLANIAPERQGQSGKYDTYHEFSESIARIPSHRVLAIRRGVKENWLQSSITIDQEAALDNLRKQFIVNPESPCKDVLEKAVSYAYEKIMWKSISGEILGALDARADREAIEIFCKNLRNLLLISPGGNVTVIGIEPALKPDVHVAVIASGGECAETGIIYPAADHPQHEESKQVLSALIEKHKPVAIVLGNGSDSRTSDEFVRHFLKDYTPPEGQKIARVVVNESGANIYSTSKMAKEELKDADPSTRCAITIGRRFQDPLAELVKIDPRAIGVGQYQHDVDQRKLRERLHAVVESCVNHVGVRLNTAAFPVLGYVSGFNRGTARRVVEHREANGAFANLAALTEIPAVNAKVFEQAAGFLRLPESIDPLDATGIHPEQYELARKIAADNNIDLSRLPVDRALLKEIDPDSYVSETAGPLAVRSILREFRNAGRDPRRHVDVAKIDDSVTSLEDLKEGQTLEGNVTNVTNFGAFVDIGVHQDGLVHVSELSKSYVRDPNDAVKIGEVVKVMVLNVDLQRRRLSLSIKQAQVQAQAPPQGRPEQAGEGGQKRGKRRPAPKKAKGRGPQKPEQGPDEQRPVTQDDIQKLIKKLATR